MRIRWSGLVPLLALVLLCTASTAQAEYLDWSYSWSMDPTTVQTISTKNGISGLTVSGWTTPGTTAPVDVVTLFPLISETAASSDDTTIPDPGTGVPNYSLTLRLTDNNIPGMDPVSVTLTGKLWGTVASTGVDLQNQFLQSTGQTVMGDYLYTVTLTKFLAPVIDGTAVTTGAITAQISMERNNPITKTPEPSTLVLAGLMVPGLMWYRGRIKRRNEAGPQAA